MIIKGKLEEISAGAWKDGINYTEFLVLDGQRHRKIMYTDYVKSFLKEGANIELSLQPPSTLQPYSFVWALKSNEEVIKEDIRGHFTYIILWQLILLLPCLFIGTVTGINLNNAPFGWISGLGILFGSVYYLTKRKFGNLRKYQSALNK